MKINHPFRLLFGFVVISLACNTLYVGYHVDHILKCCENHPMQDRRTLVGLVIAPIIFFYGIFVTLYRNRAHGRIMCLVGVVAFFVTGYLWWIDDDSYFYDDIGTFGTIASMYLICGLALMLTSFSVANFKMFQRSPQ